jgi:hypothetical protein
MLQPPNCLCGNRKKRFPSLTRTRHSRSRSFLPGEQRQSALFERKRQIAPPISLGYASRQRFLGVADAAFTLQPPARCGPPTDAFTLHAQPTVLWTTSQSVNASRRLGCVSRWHCFFLENNKDDVVYSKSLAWPPSKCATCNPTESWKDETEGLKPQSKNGSYLRIFFCPNSFFPQNKVRYDFDMIQWLA